MKKIKCDRGHDGDWKQEGTGRSSEHWTSARWILCKETTEEWWETEDAEKINVTLSKRAHPGAYKCKINGAYTDFEIQCERTGVWYDYTLFSNLTDDICEEFNSTKSFYMGVEIVK